MPECLVNVILWMIKISPVFQLSSLIPMVKLLISTSNVTYSKFQIHFYSKWFGITFFDSYWVTNNMLFFWTYRSKLRALFAKLFFNVILLVNVWSFVYVIFFSNLWVFVENMADITIEQKVKLIEFYYSNGQSKNSAVRAMMTHYQDDLNCHPNTLRK